MTRLESDSIGTLAVDSEAYYGVQSLRAKMNFGITGQHMHQELIRSLAKLKKASAVTNMEAGKLMAYKAEAISAAADEVISGKFNSDFIVDAIQGGAGTSANMNANEVIANRAIEMLGGKKGDYSIIHPNDDVNMAQSTNDVYPSAGKLTAVMLIPATVHELSLLEKSLLCKADEFDDVLKMGRTQLQDAVPMRLGQEFHAWASVIKRDIERIKDAEKSMHILNMAATAIGSAINVNDYYFDNIIRNINRVTGLTFTMADDLFDGTQNLDCFVNLSSALKTCAVDLSKICNDLRLLSSGPKTGIAEISLPAMQNGSSIMPGKVNPVIPEVVSQVAFNIIGNDLSVTMAAEAGQLELNAFEPVLFYNLFESIETLGAAASTLTLNCVNGITANRDICSRHLEESVGITTALCPYIGYRISAEIAKESLKTGVSVRNIVLSRKLLSEHDLEKILDPLSMTEHESARNKETA